MEQGKLLTQVSKIKKRQGSYQDASYGASQKNRIFHPEGIGSLELRLRVLLESID